MMLSAAGDGMSRNSDSAPPAPHAVNEKHKGMDSRVTEGGG